MRRCLLLCIGLLALAFMARAEEVSSQQAAAVAEKFLSSRAPRTKSLPAAIRLAGTWPQVQTKGGADAPALYLFERDGGGYVVVAGDDVSLPVIGYSPTGRLPLDELPVNLRDLLDWHASIIAYARDKGLKADAATKTQWLSAGGSDGKKVQLETANWYQRAPFNALAPKIDGQSCVAGCVAIATATILRYHQWPKRGTGTLPGYDFGWDGEQGTYLYHVDSVVLGHRYDWDQMPLVYEEGKYTKEQAAQVARLVYDLGVMCEMDYGLSGSSASADVPVLLATYFGYDKQIRYQYWEYFARDRWFETVRSEIDAGRPVFYSGMSPQEGGHSFVVDGYDGAFFSLNYGWGKGSEYYLLEPSVPLDKDATTEFCEYQSMVNHIMPDKGGAPYFEFVSDCLMPFPWDFRSKSFQMDGQVLYHYRSQAKEGAYWVGYALYDREGRFKAAVSDSVLVSMKDPYVPVLTCNILCDIGDEDRLMISSLVDGHWEPLPQTSDSYVVFHRSHKLSELVSVGYSLGDPNRQGYETNPCFSLLGCKNIYWEVWSDELGELLASSKETYAEKQVGDEWYLMSARKYREEEEYRALFYYPPGVYRILLRNFDEEMTLYVKL